MTRTPKPSGRKLRDRKRGRRKSSTRELRPRFLIVCEGRETETLYFKNFRVTVKVDVIGKGRNRKSLVEHARDRSSYFANSGNEYTDIWAVFDLDQNSPTDANDFNEAINLARRISIKPAYSNASFELWFLLHFQPMKGNTGNRFQYLNMLSKELGKDYDKMDRNLYDDLLPLQSKAIQNAEELMREYEKHHNPAEDKPCTTVHLLVKELKKYER